MPDSVHDIVGDVGTGLFRVVADNQPHFDGKTRIYGEQVGVMQRVMPGLRGLLEDLFR